MQVRFFNPALSYQAHKEEFDTAIQRVLTNGNLILRQDLEDFEKGLAEFCGKKYGVGLNSGTDALYLSLIALGVKSGDEVVVSSHTFVASVQVINQIGAIPVLVDLGEDWRDYITEKTRAVIPCHIAGEFLDWKPVEGIHMIDDSCQGIGVKGCRGLVQCWSFYPAKILGAFGDAGGITTDDENLARDIKDLGNHWKSDYSKWGINSRMDNLQAAVLNIKLKYLPEALEKRKAIAEKYHTFLTDKIEKPLNRKGRQWQDYIIRVPDRERLFVALKEMGIETMRNDYPFPIPKKPKSFEYESSTLRLPCNENLTSIETDYVIESINEYYA